MNLDEAARLFLAQKRFAVVGVSRDARAPANYVFRRLRDSGRRVFPVNPRAAVVEGVPCFVSLRAIPNGVDSVVVFTPANVTASVVRECAELGISRVWLHRSLGPGSFSREAEEFAGRSGIRLIPAGCPAMHCAPVDVPHRCMRWILQCAGRLPRQVPNEAEISSPARGRG